MHGSRLSLVLVLATAGCAASREPAAIQSANSILAAREATVVRASPASDDQTQERPPRLVSNTASLEQPPDRRNQPDQLDHSEQSVQPVGFDDVAERDALSADGVSTAAVETTSSAIPPAEAAPLDPRAAYPLDLSTTLALVAGQNPQVQFAQWRIQEAYAELDRADTLWLPSIQVGVSYHRHDGTYQASNGEIVDVNRSSLQGGFGAGATGAGTVPTPGLVSRFHVTDAIFAPRIAERSAWARGHAATAALHDQLLQAALAYLEVLNASQQEAISNETLANALDLAELTNDFAAAGQGLQSDADRMAAELAVRRNDLIRADEVRTVAAVRLAEVASFDFSVRLVPIETTVTPIELTPAGMDRQGLIALGLSNRPELQEANSLVAEAVERLQREKYAPLLPSVLLGLSYGGFGGGLGDQIGSVHDRADFDAMAVWEVRNLGFGERAARETARTRIEQRRWEQVRQMDRIAAEIAEAAAQVDSRRRQIDVSEDAIAMARTSYQRNLSRIRDGQGLPIEALQSLQALDVAQREYLRAVVSFNEAQFRLHRALGWPVTG